MSRTFLFTSFLATLCALDVEAQTTVRPLSTDRPDRTESPYSVPKGWLQIESDLVSHGQLEIDQQTITGTSVAAFNVKYGVTPRFDMQLVFSPWVHVHSEGPGFDESTNDTGQAGLRGKINLVGNDSEGAAVALLPFVFVPTRGDAIFDSATWGIVTPVGIAVGEQAGFLETYVARAGFESDALDDITVDAGLTFAPTDAWQLDTGVYYGVTDNTEHWRVFVGASARFSLS